MTVIRRSTRNKPIQPDHCTLTTQTISDTSALASYKPASKLCRWEDGCDRFAQGGTKFCISHGGGRICATPGCTKSAQGANSTNCIRHGGGRRCISPGCSTSARGSTGFCVIHGGGIKCHFDGCMKTAQRPSNFCIKHGGGKRCTLPGCTLPLKKGFSFCKQHSEF